MTGAARRAIKTPKSRRVMIGQPPLPGSMEAISQAQQQQQTFSLQPPPPSQNNSGFGGFNSNNGMQVGGFGGGLAGIHNPFASQEYQQQQQGQGQFGWDQQQGGRQQQQAYFPQQQFGQPQFPMQQQAIPPPPQAPIFNFTPQEQPSTPFQFGSSNALTPPAITPNLNLNFNFNSAPSTAPFRSAPAPPAPFQFGSAPTAADDTNAFGKRLPTSSDFTFGKSTVGAGAGGNSGVSRTKSSLRAKGAVKRTRTTASGVGGIGGGAGGGVGGITGGVVGGAIAAGAGIGRGGGRGLLWGGVNTENSRTEQGQDNAFESFASGVTGVVKHEGGKESAVVQEEPKSTGAEDENAVGETGGQVRVPLSQQQEGNSAPQQQQQQQENTTAHVPHQAAAPILPTETGTGVQLTSTITTPSITLTPPATEEQYLISHSQSIETQPQPQPQPATFFIPPVENLRGNVGIVAQYRLLEGPGRRYLKGEYGLVGLEPWPRKRRKVWHEWVLPWEVEDD